ncbi:MAG: ester cyclase [Terracidiphilus sp.]|jgi:predicted ester cyclase
MKRAVAFVFLICAPAFAGIAPSAASTSSTAVTQQEANKAVARRVFDEILSQGKFQVADEIYARDFLNHGLHGNASLQEDQAAARWEKQELPDMKVTYDSMVAEGDLVSVLWVLRGTNSAPVGWLPATGVKIELRGITIWRIVDGRIRDEWTAFDTLRVVRQIVEQLRWQLFGLACVAVILLWAAGRGIRKLRRSYSSAKGS